MSYAQSVLQPGETIVADGPAALDHLRLGDPLPDCRHGAGRAGIPLCARSTTALIAVTAIAFGALFVAMFAYAWFIRWITEFAVTDRRVISKRGFIWRKTEEMNMDKVETVDVDQSILGRLLDYGTIRIMGTGRQPNEIAVRRIAAPFTLRNAITAK